MTQLPSHSQHRREESERMIVLIPLFQINSKSHNDCRMLSMTSPYLCYLWAAFPNDTSDDFIGHSHLVSLMGAPAPTSSPRQRCQSWNGHISDILFFQVFYFFRYYSMSGASPAGERTPGPNPVNPFNPLMLVRPPPAGPWGTSPPFPICTQHSEQSSPGINPWIQMTVKDKRVSESIYLKTKWVKRELCSFFSDTHVFETNLQCCNIFHCHLWRGGKDNI